ncbi:MAG TPA: sigma-54 dependent transcriptional regulator [Myxococcales bacterium]|nr:sigma-54 dependent transcriptional regulator [Myxococcales bacterium]
MKARVLIVDDEKTFRVVAEAALIAEGYDVVSAASGREALERFREQAADLVILDRNLPDTDGLALLTRFREAEDGAPLVIMATAYAEVDHAVQALKLGAHDYLTKPLQLPELVHKVSVALQARRLERRLGALQSLGATKLAREVHLGDSPAMKRVSELVDAVAQSPDTTVLIEGESGTGKQVVANLIHHRTPRRAQEPFVELNAASLPEQFVESELFGHERGAFTDAKTQKRGLLELADQGSLFLDEIGELPQTIQAKLLKVLETSTFRRLGGTADIRVDVRFIAATNRDLARAVQEGVFRTDLFHRLDVFRVRLPPLRERPEDILPLAAAFTQEFAERMGKRISGLAPDAEARLRAYPYPGNVRELRNVIERAVILEAGERLSAASVLLNTPPSPGAGAEGAAGTTGPGSFQEMVGRLGRPPTLEEMERDYLARILEYAGGNKSQVSRLTGLSYPTVARKVAEYGLEKAKS